MRKFTHRIVGGAVVLSLAGALAACTDDSDVEPEDVPAGDDEGEEAAADGGNIVIAVDSDVVDLDPHGSNDTSSTHVRTNIYEAWLSTTPIWSCNRRWQKIGNRLTSIRGSST
ncbi:hypothetical protein [Geomicrobium sp. JCM 19039]|uniref:hypothetical protein n=1 Tax=Geomicrobium sp. JCM 19039 TaxID=1460636 RepID=UPI0006950C9B|nr:hypothetical protein [Geomicrobium sp. JCM 19039]